MCIWEHTLLTITASPSFFLICYTFEHIYGINLVARTASSRGSNSPFLHVQFRPRVFSCGCELIVCKGCLCTLGSDSLLRRHSCFGCCQHLWVLLVSDFILMFGLVALAPHRLETFEPFCHIWNWLGFIPCLCLFPLSLMVPGRWLDLFAAVLSWCMDFFF